MKNLLGEIGATVLENDGFFELRSQGFYLKKLVQLLYFILKIHTIAELESSQNELF